MFLDNLSTSVLRFCDALDLSYEAASERCSLSPRYFGDIARKRTAPTIHTLEKLCIGFDTTPNALLLTPDLQQQLSYRVPMKVTETRILYLSGGPTSFPICPRCANTLDREYMDYCDRCGQRLEWPDK